MLEVTEEAFLQGYISFGDSLIIRRQPACMLYFRLSHDAYKKGGSEMDVRVKKDGRGPVRKRWDVAMTSIRSGVNHATPHGIIEAANSNRLFFLSTDWQQADKNWCRVSPHSDFPFCSPN